MSTSMEYDTDQELMLLLAVAAVLALACAAVYLIIWMIRENLEANRYRARENREREDRKYLARRADIELQHDLLDLGIDRHDLIKHRTTYKDHEGVEHATYKLPRDQFAKQIQQSAQLHSRVIQALGSRQLPTKAPSPLP